MGPHLNSKSDADPNCVEPACKSKVDLFRHFVGSDKKGKREASSLTPQEAEQRKIECPLDREELGRSTWGLMHSIGVYYPEKPSEEYQRHARSFVEALALMYPCSDCAEDFRKEIAKCPPKVESRQAFSMWLCEQHNLVNEKIGKPLFQCNMSTLSERWRTGKKECWDADQKEDTIPNSLGQDD
uniref:Sulfhydryl oxidase n=1 Tax=Albugo laibachii Nc14 TaxID=890382 RepID=F0W2L6_9STRA|nr:augmenter of liver regeneration putative [Albugo laibachii Nc14]|eukprot:CCA15302.1 augmenter of liver regeneration putative [Albugo laibachii Nc14]